MTQSQETTLKFEVKSLSKKQKTLAYVEEAEALSGDIEKAIAEYCPGASVSIRREEGIPIDQIIQHLIVNIDWHAVKGGIEGAVAAFATTQVLSVLKQKTQNLFAKPVAPSSEAATGGSAPDGHTAKKTAKKAGRKAAKKKSAVKGKAKP